MSLATLLTVLSVTLLVGQTVHGMSTALETNEVSDDFLHTNINFIFDIFLKHYTKKLIEEGKTEIEIGGFERKFDVKVFSVDIEGGLKVDDGWCGNISTIRRTGNADMVRDGEVVVLSSHLGLSNLKINFNNYDLSLLGIQQNGKLKVRVGENSLWLKLNVRVKPTCNITLTEFKIEKLENILVDITNLGPFENMTDELTSWVINEITTKHRTQMEETISPLLSRALQNANLCHYIPFYILR